MCIRDSLGSLRVPPVGNHGFRRTVIKVINTNIKSSGRTLNFPITQTLPNDELVFGNETVIAKK